MTPPAGAVMVEEVMGTVVSIHAHGHAAADAQQAMAAAIARMRDDERVFSTFRHDSDISRLRDGTRTLQDVDPRILEVRERCLALREQTGGRFDAWWRGWFDPTGLVKGWATERAARAELEPLLDRPGIHAVGINAGGDLQVFTAPGADWVGRVGIADPLHHGTLLATVELVNGAVATSGTAERGAHLIDPAAGQPVASGIGATVVADALTDADAWATVAAIAGITDLSWVPAAPAGVRSGLVSDGTRTRRWAGGVEVTAASSPWLTTSPCSG